MVGQQAAAQAIGIIQRIGQHRGIRRSEEVLGHQHRGLVSGRAANTDHIRVLSQLPFQLFADGAGAAEHAQLLHGNAVQKRLLAAVQTVLDQQDGLAHRGSRQAVGEGSAGTHQDLAAGDAGFLQDLQVGLISGGAGQALDHIAIQTGSDRRGHRLFTAQNIHRAALLQVFTNVVVELGLVVIALGQQDRRLLYSRQIAAGQRVGELGSAGDDDAVQLFQIILLHEHIRRCQRSLISGVAGHTDHISAGHRSRFRGKRANTQEAYKNAHKKHTDNDFFYGIFQRIHSIPSLHEHIIYDFFCFRNTKKHSSK